MHGRFPPAVLGTLSSKKLVLMRASEASAQGAFTHRGAFTSPSSRQGGGGQRTLFNPCSCSWKTTWRTGSLLEVREAGPNAHSLCCVALNVRSGPISVHPGSIWRLHRILQVPENGSIYNVRVSVITPSKIAQAAPGPALAQLQSATEGREDGKDVKACVFFAAFRGGRGGGRLCSHVFGARQLTFWVGARSEQPAPLQTRTRAPVDALGGVARPVFFSPPPPPQSSGGTARRWNKKAPELLLLPNKQALLLFHRRACH